jgi:hypothetical protein
MSEAADADLYERDFYAWTQTQAARLRALAGDNRFDVDNVAEEIADLGRAQHNAFRQHIMRALQHLVQAATAIDDAPKPKWLGEAVDHLADAQSLLASSPKLAHEVDMARIWAQAVRTANKKLRLYDDPEFPTGLVCPFTLDALLDEKFDAESAQATLRQMRDDSASISNT